MSRTPIPPKLVAGANPNESIERPQSKIEAIAGLVPDDVCRRLVKKAHDEYRQKQADEVFLPDFDPSELEEEFGAEDSGEEPEEVRKLREFMRAHHGKKYRDIPSFAAGEEEECADDEVRNLKFMLVRSWAGILAHVLHLTGLEELPLDDALLPDRPPAESFSPFGSWLQHVHQGVGYIVDEDGIPELLSVLAEAIKVEVAKSEEGYEIICGLSICRRGDAYYLR